MRNALAYYILCRVWQHLLESADYDCLDIVSKLKFDVIDEGKMSHAELLVADAIHRFNSGLSWREDFNA